MWSGSMYLTYGIIIVEIIFVHLHNTASHLHHVGADPQHCLCQEKWVIKVSCMLSIEWFLYRCLKCVMWRCIHMSYDVICFKICGSRNPSGSVAPSRFRKRFFRYSSIRLCTEWKFAHKITTLSRNNYPKIFAQKLKFQNNPNVPKSI